MVIHLFLLKKRNKYLNKILLENKIYRKISTKNQYQIYVLKKKPLDL